MIKQDKGRMPVQSRGNVVSVCRNRKKEEEKLKIRVLVLRSIQRYSLSLSCSHWKISAEVASYAQLPLKIENSRTHIRASQRTFRKILK